MGGKKDGTVVGDDFEDGMRESDHSDLARLSFTIMTYDQDVGCGGVFGRIYQLLQGPCADTARILEAAYAFWCAAFEDYALWHLVSVFLALYPY